MKIWKNKFLKQMIIVITVIFLVMNCVAPNYVYANKSTSGIVINIGSWVATIAGAAATAFLVAAAVPSGGMSLAAVPAVAGAVGKGAIVTFGMIKASDVVEDGLENIPGNILEEFIDFTVAIADVCLGALQNFMFNEPGMWANIMISNKDDNLGAGASGKEDSGSWLYAGESDVKSLKKAQPTERGSSYMFVERDAIEEGVGVLSATRNYEVPNILYSPENIFANKIAALDSNYINPHQYTGITEEVGNQESLATIISPTVATWYRAFRNIAIVGLLSVLVYIGIRIVIGTVSEKAKYKERLQDWFVALCMIFFMHFIMAGIMMISEKIIDSVGSNANTGIMIEVDDGCIFRTTFTGYIRFFAQMNSWRYGVGYSLMYLVLVGITIRYTFIYLKRALYLAFFTVIAPMVALTYPLDKIKDSEAQAFNIWIKEYFINAILQPMHLLLFTVLVGSTMSLAIKNPIYGIVVLLFMPTAENWIKRMFKMDKAPLSATSLGDVAVLGTIFGMGKNIATGVVKGVGTTAGAVRDGGIKALSTGIRDSFLGAPARAFSSGISGIKKFRGSSGNNVEDTVNQSTEETTSTTNNTTNNNYGNINDYRDRVADENLRTADDYYRAFQEQNDEEAKMKKAADQIRNNLPDDGNLEVSPQGLEIPVLNFDDFDSTYTVENAQKSDDEGSTPSSPNRITGNSETNTVTNNVTNNETTTAESENDKAEMREKTIKNITKNDAGKDVKEMINKGLGGVAGAMAGLATGAFTAGLTADNKMLLAGTLGGAHVGSSAADSLMKFGDTTYNNNVKVLVKDGVSNKDIIKNTAQIAQKENWSEDKMKTVAKMAEKYPNLENDINQVEKLTDEFRAAGLKNDKLIQRAINDVRRVQKGLDEKNKNIKDQNKSDKNIKNWK